MKTDHCFYFRHFLCRKLVCVLCNNAVKRVVIAQRRPSVAPASDVKDAKLNGVPAAAASTATTAKAATKQRTTPASAGETGAVTKGQQAAPGIAIHLSA